MIFSEVYHAAYYPLCSESIDRISSVIEAYCQKMKIDRNTQARYRLSAEESLGVWLGQIDDPDAQVFVELGRKLRRPYLKLTVEGRQVNPYQYEISEEYGRGKNALLVQIGLIPEYSYANGKNTLHFKLKRKPVNQVVLLLAVIALSLIVGICGRMLIPADIVGTISANFISPIENAAFRILSSIAGPMIFLSVAWGVYGIGDVYTLGRIGKKMMLAFIKVIFLFSLLGTLFYPFLGPAVSASSVGDSQISKIFEMLLSIFPSDIFTPFIEGNTLQIIFLAFIIGLSLIFLGQRTSSVARAVEQINHIITFMMGFISRLVPFFVFVVLVNIIWSDALDGFSKVWKFAVAFIGVSLLGQFLFLLFVSIRHKKNLFSVFTAILPSYLIALTTASSSATFESNMRICKAKFQIKQELSSFGIPFGMVIFKPTLALFYLFVCFYFASVNGVAVSASWIATAIVITAVASIATPPIPGGAAATYTILFLQLGIPAESLVMVIAIDMIFDFFITAGDMNMLLLELLHISNKLGMVEAPESEKTQS